MKKFIQPKFPDGGVPFFADDFMMMQNEIFTAYTSMFGLLDSEIVLSGCDVTITTYPSHTPTFNIGPGYVLIAGEVMKFDGISSNIDPLVNAVWLIKGAPVKTSRSLGPNSPHPSADVIEEIKATTVLTSTSATVPAVGVTGIRFCPFPSKRFPDIISRKSKKIGEIIIFTGSTLQNGYSLFDGTGKGLYGFDGFALCNGQNQTSDLRGRFLVGLTNTDNTDHGYVNTEKILADYSTIGNAKGERAHLLTAAESGSPSHTHGATVNDPGHFHRVNTERNGATGKGGDSLHDYSASNVTTVSQTGISVSVNGNNAQNASQAHENRPPYYTLAFIQRIA